MIKKNIFSILVALIILYLSLTNAHTFDRVPLFNIPNLDKIVHFLMYFGFMSVIILENWKSMKHSGQLFLLALIPFVYGVLMEILQTTLTVNRTGSIYDVAANSAGICGSILVFYLIRPFMNGHIRS
jgi:VanZ family protein